MNVVVCGSRGFFNYDYFKKEMCCVLKKYQTQDIILISGGAKGADTFAREYALENNITFKEYLADWENHGRGAGYIRNIEMLDIANEVVAFWDGKSPGTAHIIKECLKLKIPITVFEV